MRAPNAPAWLTARPIAHRGLHDAAKGVIENTASAARAAIEAGFAIECDVQMSADGEIFVFHDEALDRLTDASGLLIEKTAAEIKRVRITPPVPSLLPGLAAARPAPHPCPLPARGERGSHFPTFAELLGLVAGRTPIVCELKSRFDRDWRIADRIVAFAETYQGPLAFKSFDPDLVAYLRLRWPLLGPPGAPARSGSSPRRPTTAQAGTFSATSRSAIARTGKN